MTVTHARIQLAEGWHLSPVRDGDQAAFVEHLQDGEVSLAIPVIPHPYTQEAADAWVQYRLRMGIERGVDPCLAIRDPEGKLFGTVGLDDQREPSASREVGYWIASTVRRRGLASAALSAFLPYAHLELKAERLSAHAQAWNAGSLRVLEKAGFTRQPVPIAHITTRNGVHEVLAYARELI